MDLVVTSKDRIYLGLFFALLVHMGGVGVSAILYVGSRSVLVLSLSLSPLSITYIFDRLTFVRHSFLSAFAFVQGQISGLQRLPQSLCRSRLHLHGALAPSRGNHHSAILGRKEKDREKSREVCRVSLRGDLPLVLGTHGLQPLQPGPALGCQLHAHRVWVWSPGNLTDGVLHAHHDRPVFRELAEVNAGIARRIDSFADPSTLARSPSSKSLATLEITVFMSIAFLVVDPFLIGKCSSVSPDLAWTSNAQSTISLSPSLLFYDL